MNEPRPRNTLRLAAIIALGCALLSLAAAFVAERHFSATCRELGCLGVIIYVAGEIAAGVAVLSSAAVLLGTRRPVGTQGGRVVRGIGLGLSAVGIAVALAVVVFDLL